MIIKAANGNIGLPTTRTMMMAMKLLPTQTMLLRDGPNSYNLLSTWGTYGKGKWPNDLIPGMIKEKIGMTEVETALLLLMSSFI